MRHLPRALAVSFAMIAMIAVLGPASAREAPASFADLAEKLLPAVVNIATTQVIERGETGDQELEEFFRDFFDRQGRSLPPRQATSLGSGFIIDPAGFIVTNNHVIADADEVKVRLQDDREYKATIVGRDTKTDLALLKVEAPGPLPYLVWGDSDKTRIGDWVIAIGNPFGLGGSVTAGIVSARQRDIRSGPYDDFLQTDAAINRGNSGGPMFNMDGEVVGINTAIISPSGGSIGIGFAVPSAIAQHVMEQIRQFGHTRRGWLGVRIQSITDELAEGLRLKDTTGALIANVTPGGPAEKAGIQQGDVILRFDGQPIDEMRKLPRFVADTSIDKSVEVVLWRKGAEQTVRVTVGELDETEEAAVEAEAEAPTPSTKGQIDLLGMSLADMSAELRQRFELPDDVNGVVITDVKSEGPASEKALAPGDVVVEVDQQAVSTPADVERRVNQAKANGYRVVTMLVYRQGDYQWVALRIDQG
jgi:serine protease Do